MGNAWFETVAEAQRRAKKRLPASVYGALVAGSEKGLTVRDNISAFSELGFAPHVAGLAAKHDLSTTVMGQPVSLPVIPERLDLKTAIQFAPQVLRRPKWLLGYARTGRVPDLTVPNMVAAGEQPPTFFGAYGQWAASPLPTWEDVRWLREQWGGPFMVKGVIRVDDA